MIDAKQEVSATIEITVTRKDGTVETYKANGDVFTDDTAALQAALDSAAEGDD